MGGCWRSANANRNGSQPPPRVQAAGRAACPSNTIEPSISVQTAALHPSQTCMTSLLSPLSKPLFLLRRCAKFGAVVALAVGAVAHADSYADITSLLKASKPAQALTVTEQRAAKNPRDPQLRFLRAVAQADLGKTDEAIATLVELTQEYPELAEPHNNLGVLYAAQNQLDKARYALEAAIRAKPTYATAHENLGDMYARLAGESYAKALQLDAGRTAALQPKLALIRQLSGMGASPVAAMPAKP